GTRTSAVGWPGRASVTVCNIGRPKASVLPEPVLALPHTSRPARASSMVAAWMAKGSSMPWAARASTISALRPSDRKVVTFGCTPVTSLRRPVLGSSRSGKQVRYGRGPPVRRGGVGVPGLSFYLVMAAGLTIGPGYAGTMVDVSRIVHRVDALQQRHRGPAFVFAVVK